jgi:hypothetical protein
MAEATVGAIWQRGLLARNRSEARSSASLLHASATDVSFLQAQGLHVIPYLQASYNSSGDGRPGSITAATTGVQLHTIGQSAHPHAQCGRVELILLNRFECGVDIVCVCTHPEHGKAAQQLGWPMLTSSPA